MCGSAVFLFKPEAWVTLAHFDHWLLIA